MYFKLNMFVRFSCGFLLFVTSSQEVMFLPLFVCLLVCLSVSGISEKVVDEFSSHFEKR